MLMIVLDVTIVNVALPSIQEDLHFSTSSLAWVVNAYLIAFGGLLLLAGRMGDLVGRRRIFLAGVAVFTGASLLCGVAQSASWLVAARFIQGVGGAMTSAVILGMIVTMFPERREQAKAIGVFAFVASAGGSVGLLAGGVLTQSINWHWIFFVNLPIGAATALAARRLVPGGAGLGLRAGADVPGALLITAALMLGVYTIVDPAAKQGWGAADTLALGACSIALLAAFLVRETRARSPLMPLRISARARSSPPTRSRSCRWRGCSGCSSSARSTCEGCSATTRCTSGSPSCRPRSRWGRSRSATPSGCSSRSGRGGRCSRA
jgi:MFS family permease